MNPTPSLTENYVWIPETSDNVVPGLDPLITYIQPTYATLTALRHNITHIINTIQTEINNSEFQDKGGLNVNKEIYYHRNYTDYTFQRNITIHNYDNRRIFLHSKTILHINEKVTKSYKFSY